MTKLFLFDVDRTLVEGPINNRYTRAIENLHSVHREVNFDLQGLTDKLILEAMLEQEGWTDKQIDTAMPDLLREMHRVYLASFEPGSVRLLPGVRELLDELQKRDITLGLITGNMESVAEIKLNDAGIWQYFSVGGYGSDPHVTRGDLVKVAVNKADFAARLDAVYAFGDTPRDIAAAHEGGVANSVGVANGYRDTQELIDAGAKIVLPDFKDTAAVLSALGLA